MIIYCAGPIKGDLTYQKFYKDIIEIVLELGHTPLSELNPDFKSTIPLTDKQIYSRDIKWIDRSNIMIAEVSGPSLGVGFEIAYAVFKKQIPVLGVANKKAVKVSSMILGCDSVLLNVKRYEDTGDLADIIQNYINRGMI
jgi:2'-deoxynucleoside 5'-phosphate N-hydrolase